MSDRIVIVGAGHAGTQAAVSLRQLGFSGQICLFGAESDLPYQRPPLSKKYLTGHLADEQIALRNADWYASRDVDLRTGARVTAVDLDEQRVTLGDGERVPYDRLLLATGSQLRRLPVPGAELPRVHYLRSAADARALAATLREASTLVVVGAGYVGLEVASSAMAMDIDEVTVVEQADRILPRVASTEMARALARLHEREGVDLRCGASVTAVLEEHGRAGGVALASGERIEADAVVIGVGVAPATTLAEEAGLRVDDGIVVDEYCQTSNPHVFAAGDCTSHPNRFVRHRIRLESVPNATQQGRTAAAAMMGAREPHGEAPWFWTEQFGVRLQTAGLLENRDETILRGNPASDCFALFHLQQGRLACVESLDRVQEFMLARKLIEAQVAVDDVLADESVPFKTIVDRLLGAAS